MSPHGEKTAFRRAFLRWQPTTRAEGQAMLSELVTRASCLVQLMNQTEDVGPFAYTLDLLEDMLDLAFAMLDHLDKPEEAQTAS
jgi:hypothetical protein